jgi:DNA polymerase I-like protein with 3'-5' exonuclease and polymerase domains
VCVTRPGDIYHHSSIPADLIDTGYRAHNASYDSVVFFQNMPAYRPKLWDLYEAGKIHCTKLREKLLDLKKGILGTRRYSLKDIVKRRYNKDMDKDTWRMGYEGLIDTPLSAWPEGAKEYAIGDAVYTDMVYVDQEKEAERYPLSAFRAESGRQAAFDFALFLTSCRGMKVDREAVKNLRAKYTQKMLFLAVDLRNEGILRPGGTKDLAKIREIVTDCLGDQARKTDSGLVSTDSDTLLATGHPALLVLSEFNHAQKFLQTFVSALSGSGVVHTNYDCLKETGRTSSSSPNIQNLPREPGVRECFVPRPGYAFVACDYDSQELRALSQCLMDLFGKSELARRYSANPSYDPHTVFAARLMGVSGQRAEELKATGDKSLKEFRQRAKAANFGFPGGMGAETLREYAKGYGINLSIADSEKLKETWFAENPEMQAYFRHVNGISRDGMGSLTQLRSNRVRGQISFCAAANSYFQGLSSDISKTALFLTAKESFDDRLSSDLLDCRPVCFIHDEIIIEVPLKKVGRAASRLEAVMVEAAKLWCPDVPFRASSRIMMDRWSKDG